MSLAESGLRESKFFLLYPRKTHTGACSFWVLQAAPEEIQLLSELVELGEGKLRSSTKRSISKEGCRPPQLGFFRLVSNQPVYVLHRSMPSLVVEHVGSASGPIWSGSLGQQ